MNIKLINKREEKLFSRTNLEAEADFETATPSRNDVKQAIASAMSSSPNLVVIRSISQKFGSKKAGVKSYVYNNEADLKKIESQSILGKGLKKKEAKAE